MQTPKFTKVITKVLTTLLGAALAATLVGSPASAGPPSNEELSSLVAQARRYAGVPAIAGHSALRTLAKRQAQRMASAQAIFHNTRIKDDLNAITKNWTVVGENVGRGYSVRGIHDAMMRSTSHRNNIISTKWNKSSVAVVVGGDGRFYVAEIFAYMT